MALIEMNTQHKTKTPSKPKPAPDKPPTHKQAFEDLLDMAIKPPKKPPA